MDPYAKELAAMLEEMTDRYETVLYSEFSKLDDEDKIIARAKAVLAKGVTSVP